MTEELPAVPPRLPARPAGIDTLVAEFIAGRKKTTSDAYSRDLKRFAQYLGVDTVEAAAKYLFGADQGTANRVGAAYKAHLLDLGLSSATINRYLAAVKSFSKFANFTGIVPWEIKIMPVKSEPRRIARGPDKEGFERLLAHASQQTNAFKMKRDRAMLWLFFGLALRENEVVSLDMKDIELEEMKIKIRGKGFREQKYRTLSAEVRDAIKAWIEVRGKVPGALFTGRGANGAPLHNKSVYNIVRRLGRACGIKVWPHALRHCGVTVALKKYPLRDVQRFSRHADMKTLMLYDDDLSDLGGDITKGISLDVVDPGAEKSP